ncbi:hypothetical protein [Marinobacter sp.]|uniref:hypothetical protein n=1 Tax=Marinobacter sp. TaxID=50741 RepID=UPI0035652AEA
MKLELKKVIPTYLAVIVLNIIAGAFAAMVISGETTPMLKFGLLVLIALIGFACANIFGRVARAFEETKGAIRAITPLVSLTLVLPAVTMAILFGLI